jgi:hypothetical protein
MVPGRREGELAIRGYDNVRDEMIMATKDAFGVAIRILVTSELPHDDCLIYAKALCLGGKTPRLDEGYVTSRGG